MTSKHLGWLLSGSLLFVLAGCDVKIGKCDRDAGDCDFNFDEDEDDIDSGSPDGGESDADASVDGDADTDASVDSDAGADAGDGDGPVYEGEPLALDGLCDALSSRRLAWDNALDECECSTDDANILRDEFGVFGADNAASGCITANQGQIDSGKVTYNENAAGACVDAYLKHFEAPPATCPEEGFKASYFLANIGHGAPAIAQIPACRATFVGKLTAGAECTNDLQCPAELRCIETLGGGVGATRTCRTAFAIGASCSRDAECVLGATCVGNASGGGKQCSKELVISGNCSRSAECEVGRVCIDEGDKQQCRAQTETLPVCEQP